VSRRLGENLLALLRHLAAPRWLALAFASYFCLRRTAGNAWTPVFDPDIWWVAAAGRITLATGQPPRHNLFSFSDPEQPWIMHEWLLGPLYAFGLAHMGPRFFVLIALCVYGLGLFLLVRATLGRAQNTLAGTLLASVGAVFFLRRLVSARPMHLALLFPLLLTSLAFGPAFTGWHLLGCVALEWLWANCHGSFPLGIALLMAAALDQPRGRALRCAAALGALAVTFVNPYGARLHLFVWNYLSGHEGIYRSIQLHISEFASMHEAWGRLIKPQDLVGCALALAASLAAASERKYRVRGLLSLALWIMAVRQARHFELAGVLTCLLLVPWADARLRGWARPSADEAAFRRRASALLLLPTYLLALRVYFVTSSTRQPSDWLDREYAFADSLSAVPASAHLFIPFAFAGYAIWHGYPRGIRVFFDPRNDCYSPHTLDDYLVLDSGNTPATRALALLDASHIDTVLVPSEHPLIAALANAPHWQRLPDSGEHGFRRRSSIAEASFERDP
jgi:hypothetical protein